MLLLLLMACGIAPVCRGACPERIKTFYTTYLKNVLENDSQNAELCKNWMTKALIAKIERVGAATGADPVIRAQDANEDAIETLTVKPLGDDWYMVTYLWKKGDASTITEIPLKTQQVDGVCKITYITPIWNGSRYGDELLPCKEKDWKKEISQASEQAFLQSFYDAYTAAYCAMPDDLDAALASLREHYLSERALVQYREAEAENEADGLVGYDRLIDHVDFDCQWCPTLRIVPLHGSDYEVCYWVGDKSYRITITVKKEEKGYRIDRLQL